MRLLSPAESHKKDDDWTYERWARACADVMLSIHLIMVDNALPHIRVTGYSAHSDGMMSERAVL